MKLTVKERRMIHHIVHNKIACGDINAGTYAFVICGDKAGAAVLGSLIKKGLATTEDYDAQGKSSETEQWISLTDEGRKLYDNIKHLYDANGNIITEKSDMTTKTTTAELLKKYNLLAVRAGKKTLKEWKESRAKLELRIKDLLDDIDEKPETKKTTKKSKKGETKKADGEMSLADLAREMNINPKVARAKIRRQEKLPIAARPDNGRWTHFTRGGDTHQALVMLLKAGRKEVK